MKYTSNAQWPKGTIAGSADDVSRDEHTHKLYAESICMYLQNVGFGGDRKIFPIRTWVEEVKEETK